MTKTAVVVGAGLGGLATAVRLNLDGWDVTVLEKNEQVGGRCNVLRDAGFTFDMGPTLLLMRDVLDDLFERAGADLSEYMDLVRVNPNYRVYFGNGGSVEFSSDAERMERELDAFEPGAGAAFRRYLTDAGYKYRVARDRFVERNFYHWWEFITPTNLYYLLTTNTLRMLDRHAGRYFRDPRLIAAFTFQTMYLGLAPRQAPAIYSLLPYTEIEEGIWFPRGGMYQVAEGLRALAENLGVRICTSSEVTSVPTLGRRATGVCLADGRFVAADVVVSNADLPYTYGNLVPRALAGPVLSRRIAHLNYGSSAFLMYLGLDREYPHLHHHDVYLSSDVADNFDAIFRHGRLPDDPSFYTCAPSRTDRSMAPEGGESLYVLVPVPHLSPNADWSVEKDAFTEQMYRRLEDTGLRDIRQHVVTEHVYTPEDFVSDYNIVNGSAFGISHNFWQVGYLRPGNKAPGLDNLYLVGASTVPGGGVPMVILGSRLTAERVKRDWARA